MTSKAYFKLFMMNLYFWFSTLCAFGAVSEACNCRSQEAFINKLWTRYKDEFSKTYDPEEEPGKKCNWLESAISILKHNWEAGFGKHTFTIGFNTFSDSNTTEDDDNGCLIPPKERQEHPNSTRLFKTSGLMNFPQKLDWRERGVVTPVKNQGHCGSCWAFSAVAALESQILLKHGGHVDLSEQNLLDCSSNYGNHGCKGGSPQNAFFYIIENGGIESEWSYPYKGKVFECKYKRYKSAATCRDYGIVPIDDEDALLEALATVGPISVAVHGSLKNFKHYTKGIYHDPRCRAERVNHAVLLVGYGTEHGIDYWTIKNSYGPQWGDNGYIRIQRNMNNLCGIARDANYPII